jgi:hypothetical protein
VLASRLDEVGVLVLVGELKEPCSSKVADGGIHVGCGQSVQALEFFSRGKQLPPLIAACLDALAHVLDQVLRRGNSGLFRGHAGQAG